VENSKGLTSIYYYKVDFFKQDFGLRFEKSGIGKAWN